MTSYETFFIKANGFYWLPRPTSWLGGWARNRWFNRVMKSKSKIASYELWNSLRDSHDVMRLIEKDGIVLTLHEEQAEFDGAGTYLTWPPSEKLVGEE